MSKNTVWGKAEAGDFVKITLEDEELKGVLLPRPAILDSNITILKLSHGYNIGIDNSKIKKIEVIEKYKKIEEKTEEIKHNPKLPTVTILSLGGTISSKIDYKTGGTSADYTAKDFLTMCPELNQIANIKAKKVMAKMSEDLTPSDWIKLGEEIAKALIESDGVVVTQGTDTLHFTSAAESFILRNLNKAVIFTAAQRSIDRGSTDAFMNLICAVNCAANFDGVGVYTCMHGTINDDYCLLIRGTKVRKMHTSRRDAFRPINEKAIARVILDGRIEITNENYPKKQKENMDVVVGKNWENKVALILVYPNMDPAIIGYYLKQGYKGIVLSASALGHVAVNGPNSLVPYLENAKQNGVPIVIASQTLYGRVHPYVYSNLRKLSMELNCIFVEDMMPEVAYVKLMHLLGNIKNKSDIFSVKKKMQTNFCGEITEREMPDTFLI